MNIPNLITLLRLLLAPVVIWLLLERQSSAALALFILAGITDALDGMLAKRLGQVTELGTYLDPIADKVLLVGIFITLGVMGGLPAWLVLLVVSRDMLIVGGVLLLYTMDFKIEMHPLMISKINTVAQIILIALVLGHEGVAQTQIVAVLITYAIWLVALTTAASGCAYIYVWITATASSASGGGNT